MAIAARTVNGKASADLHFSGSLTVSLGSAVVATDAVVLVIGVNGGGAAATLTAPAGWTAVTTRAVNGAIALQGFVAYGNVANFVFTQSGGSGSQDLGWVTQAFTGVNQATIVDVAGAAASNTGSATISAPTFNTVTDQALQVIGAVDFLASGAFSATGFTAAMNGATNCQAGMLYGNSAVTPAGATGAKTVTDSAGSSSNTLVVMPFALRPAAGGSPFLPAARFPGGRQAAGRASYY